MGRSVRGGPSRGDTEDASRGHGPTSPVPARSSAVPSSFAVAFSRSVTRHGGVGWEGGPPRGTCQPPKPLGEGQGRHFPRLADVVVVVPFLFRSRLSLRFGRDCFAPAWPRLRRARFCWRLVNLRRNGDAGCVFVICAIAVGPPTSIVTMYLVIRVLITCWCEGWFWLSSDVGV